MKRLLNPNQKLLNPHLPRLKADVGVDKGGQPKNASAPTCAAAQINADAQTRDVVK